MDKQLAADLYGTAFDAMIADGILVRTAHHQGDTLAINPAALWVDTDLAFLTTNGNKRRLAVPRQDADHLRNMPCLDAPRRLRNVIPTWGLVGRRFSQGDLRRVIAAEHTGLLGREEREALEQRFKAGSRNPGTKTCSRPRHPGDGCGHRRPILGAAVCRTPEPGQLPARIGRAGRRDGNAMITTLADGNSPHDLYFFAQTKECWPVR